jgi:phosphatidylglycerophosphatase C
LQKSIAFFDFDGTVTKKDTMLELARFSRGNLAFFAGMTVILPWLLLMKIGLVSRTKAKERLLTYFFGNMPLQKFNETCLLFIKRKLPGLIREEAMKAIQSHLDKQTIVVIVSASAENWVAPWCIQHKLQYICTRLDVIGNVVTGKLLHKNCNGEEKVIRIKQLFNLSDYTNIYCYGDSPGDRMMLGVATHPFYKSF